MVRNSLKLKPHTFIWRFGSINRGAAAGANQTRSAQRDLQHRDPDMTPTIISKEHLPLNNKLRKPIVEKMRRDRINSSIEQLKCLLAPEFLQQQQPDSQLEKADILEMTFNFLQRQCSGSHAVNRGFSRCVCESVHFLSTDEMKTQSQRRLLKPFQKLQTSCDQNRRESVLPRLSGPDQNTFSKEMNVNKSAIWRPW